jgi:hypothetical protein
MYKNIIYVPSSHELMSMILKEMHNVPYVGHPGYQKIVATMNIHYYWPSVKKEIAKYITRCMECLLRLFCHLNEKNRGSYKLIWAS